MTLLQHIQPRRATLIAAAITVIAASAQNMSTQIVVERQIEPEYRPAVRPSGVSPVALAPTVTTPRLSAAPYSALARLDASLTMLEPAAWGDTLYVSPFRGYANLGYLPAANAAASLGYTFINTRNSRVSAFADYLAYKYHGYRDADDGQRAQTDYSHQELRIGADALHRLDRHNTLAASVEYAFGSTQMPEYAHGPANTFKQNTNRAHFAADWSHRGSLAADAGASVRYFGFTKDIYNTGASSGTLIPEDPMSEALYNIHGNIAVTSGKWLLRLRAAATWQHHSPAAASLYAYAADDGVSDDALFGYAHYDYHTNALYTFTPSAEVRSSSFTGIFGVRLDLSRGGFSKKFYAAPDIRLNWQISSRVALWARVGGGKVLNTLEDLYAYTPYMSGAYGYDMSSIPVTVDAGINMGPFSGFSIALELGGASANEWLMPAMANGANCYEMTKVAGIHYRAALAWDALKWFSAHASIEGATQSEDGDDGGYYLWRDRARWQTNVGIALRPLKPLTLSVDWNLRTKRRAYELGSASFLTMGFLYHKNIINLGNINDISASAAWQFSERLSAHVMLTNILCRRYYIIPGVASARLGGTLGVSYQF